MYNFVAWISPEFILSIFRFVKSQTENNDLAELCLSKGPLTGVPSIHLCGHLSNAPCVYVSAFCTVSMATCNLNKITNKRNENLRSCKLPIHRQTTATQSNRKSIMVFRLQFSNFWKLAVKFGIEIKTVRKMSSDKVSKLPSRLDIGSASID